MSKDIKLKHIDNIVNNDYISKIDNIIENINDIVLEVRVIKYKIFELKDYILAILHLEDNTGSICALLAGNRDDKNLKKIISNIGINSNYLIRGSISLLDKDTHKDLENMTSNINIKDYFNGNKLLLIQGMQNISKNYREYQKVEMFGVDIITVYDFNLKEAFDFVSKNTDYLKNIAFDEVKEIKFSAYKDIVILLKTGKLLFNGNVISDNIKTLGLTEGLYIFSFSNDNIITCLTDDSQTTNFINNDNYKYKKIIMDGLGIVTLTYENTIRYFGTLIDGIIDYNNFTNVDDIGYVEDENDIVIIKKDKVISLLNNQEYSSENDNILLEGSSDHFIIIN